jgi:thioredoxin-dependent peroxiredoxin
MAKKTASRSATTSAAAAKATTRKPAAKPKAASEAKPATKPVSKPAAKAATKPATKAPAKSKATAAPAGVLEPGAKAPPFTLVDQAGTPRSLKDYAGGPLILYFYPKDDTEDCTAQACSFNDRLPALEKVGAAVLGVSRLDAKSKAKFAKKHGLTFPLLADEDGAVCSKYGTWVQKSMYGKSFMGVTRTTYLIDAKGTIARRWDKVQVDGHAAEVMDAIKAL